MNKINMEIITKLKWKDKEVPVADLLKELLEQNANQKNRIDKAIEYIHNHQLVFELSSKEQIQKWFDEFYTELLSILRGENNE